MQLQVKDNAPSDLQIPPFLHGLIWQSIKKTKYKEDFLLRIGKNSYI